MVSDSPIDNILLTLEMRCCQQRAQRLLQTVWIIDFEDGLPFGLRRNDPTPLQCDLSRKVAEQILLQAEFQSLLHLVKSRECVGIQGARELLNIFKYLCGVLEQHSAHQHRLWRSKIQAA